MLEDIKKSSYEDLEEETQDMLNKKENSLLGAYSSYSQLKHISEEKEPLLEEDKYKSFEQSETYINGSETLLDSPMDDYVHIPGEQVETYIKNILSQGIKYNATDIHIDEINGLSRVRYRVDGKLVADNSGYAMIHTVLTQKLKIMAEFFKREKAIIEKAVVSYYIDVDKKIQFSVMVLPTVDSELVVIKMPGSSTKLKFTDIGMTSEDVRTLGDIFEKQSGMVMISGLSGSGRTTTLYTLLNKIISEENNILTIEKKIFERINGICQIEVGECSEVTLKDVLKNIGDLDIDIDIVVVDSEIDADSVKLLINIALSGKLVIVTSYFPTAYDTIVGLISMGIEPYSIAAALEGIIAQQLLRKACPECYKHNKNNKNKKVGKHENKSCRVCSGALYKGKTAVFEVFKMKREYWSVILKKDETDKLKDMLENENCSFGNNCKRFIESGIISVEEAMRTGIAKKINESI